nr:hypothetical protein [Tanacetum cinerariifolium]
MGIMPTETELTLEKNPTRCFVMKSRDDGNPSRANIKQALGTPPHDVMDKVAEIILITAAIHKTKATSSVTMEILLEPTSNKLLVGDVGDSIWIELVTLDINLGPE